MKKFLKIVGWMVLALVVLAGGAYAWAYQKAMGKYHQVWDVQGHDFAVPFPLRDDEVAALRADRLANGADRKDPLADVDLQAIAMERAVKRGKHLVDTRLGCAACHGADLGGLAVIDAAIVARWVAPNLTQGEGSVTKTYTARDWDRAVRHGIRHNGQSSTMPSEEFVNLTDHELSDVIAYVRTIPAVNRDLGPVKLGPIFTFVAATDPRAFIAFNLDHTKSHAVEPPVEAPSVELGQHIAQVCTGCHGPTLAGGKMQGDPNMPIVANLTPHETGLKGWTEADFIRSLREGTRKDGTAISEFMPWKAYGQMRDTELKAIWAYLETVPAKEKGSR